MLYFMTTDSYSAGEARYLQLEVITIDIPTVLTYALVPFTASRQALEGAVGLARKGGGGGGGGRWLARGGGHSQRPWPLLH